MIQYYSNNQQQQYFILAKGISYDDDDAVPAFSLRLTLFYTFLSICATADLRFR